MEVIAPDSADPQGSAAPRARIPLVSAESADEAQRKIYDAIVTGPRGMLVGPLRAALHSPELADRWQKLGEVLRFNTSLPKRLSELAILVTGRHWNSQIEWHIHAKAAAEAGMADPVIEAIRQAQPPNFEYADESTIYEFTRQLLSFGSVSETTYREAESLLGVIGLVEVTAVVGYYSMVAMTLNAHHIPMPDGIAPPLSAVAGSTVAEGLPSLTPLPKILSAPDRV